MTFAFLFVFMQLVSHMADLDQPWVSYKMTEKKIMNYCQRSPNQEENAQKVFFL